MVKKLINKKSGARIFILLSFLALVVTITYIVVLKKTLDEKDYQIRALQQTAEVRDPFLDYALSFKKYDAKGAKPTSFSCFDRKPKENMTSKEKFWYNAAAHNPVIPEGNPKIRVIEASLKKLRTQADEICLNQRSTDYVVIYRYEYEKGLYKNSADLYRFHQDLTYDLYHLSDNFDLFKTVSWLSNNDLIYDVVRLNSHTVYVFTASNEDLLLEVCNINMNDKLTNGNLTASFTCKNFNSVANSSSHLPKSLLDEFVGSRTF